jgi:hypothetical protein
LDLQDRMRHPVAFHAEMMVTSCTSTRPCSRMMHQNLSRQW